MAPSHNGVFLFYHYNLQGSCLRTVIQPLVETAGLLISWVFSFLPRTIPPSTDQQGGISFQTTPMGKITHTHSPRTGVESSTTYLRVQICAYSPRTGIRSKCLQNPWEVTLTMELNHLRRLQDAICFSFFTTTNRRTPTGTARVGFFFLTTTNQQIPTGTTYTNSVNENLLSSVPPPTLSKDLNLEVRGEDWKRKKKFLQTKVSPVKVKPQTFCLVAIFKVESKELELELEQP